MEAWRELHDSKTKGELAKLVVSQQSEINRLKEFDKIDFTYWLYEEITIKKPSSELVQSLLDEYTNQNQN